ncbi:protein of unknown function [Hyphomicrobium sp. MC1]|nr:protein of unknown function [Hyphomicrobium sp. MC1]
MAQRIRFVSNGPVLRGFHCRHAMTGLGRMKGGFSPALFLRISITKELGVLK